MAGNDASLEHAYQLARERYAQWGVDVEAATNRLAGISISLHCWQGDDVGGFENPGGAPGGGLAITGNYPGKATTPDQLRDDIDQALALLPGRHRLNLHAFYAETGGKKVDRDALAPEHFGNWISWAQSRRVGLDFNPTFFAHPRAADGLTLTHRDQGVRRFWVNHGIACRRIGKAMGAALGTAAVTNVWIPDGSKESPVDRLGPRTRLLKSLDEIFAEPIDPALNLDAVEPKLFGIGSESYVAGSHEFYLGYAMTRGKLICLDAGHCHPTESIADKISSVLCYLDRMLLHVSRGVRWDSDHVVTLGDELQATVHELVRGDFLGRVHIGLDYFDASINRIAAWVIGGRSMLKSLLIALLEPTEMLQKLEIQGDFTARLALIEELKTMPAGAVWDYYCARSSVPVGREWLAEVKAHERKVMASRT